MDSMSDDTGYFSQETDQDSYDNLLTKYLKLKTETVKIRDPFDEKEINIDELLTILMKSPGRSGLAVTAVILELTVEILVKQIDIYQRCIYALASSTKSCKKIFRNKNTQPSESTSTGTSPEQTEFTHRRIKKKNISCNGKFIVNNDKAISFELEEAASSDVIQRRNFLKMKFQELSNDSAYCHFDMYSWYNQESSFQSRVDDFNDNVNVDGTPLFLSIRKETNPNQMKCIPSFNLELGTEELEDMDDGGDSPSLNENYTDSPLPDNNPAEQLDSINEPEMNNEDTQYFECEIDPQLILKLSLENNENVITEIHNINAENDTKKAKKCKMKRKLNDRIPLEPINERIIPEPENMAIEFKRAKLGDSLEDCNSLDISSFLFERTIWDNMEMPEIPDIIQDLPTDWSEIDKAVTEGEGSLPMLSSCEYDSSTILQPRLRPSPVDMKAVVGQMEKVIDRELDPSLSQTTELSFLDLITKSGVNIVERNQQVFAHSSYTPHNVSVSVALLAALHMAHHKQVYLVPDDNNLMNVTRERPHNELSSFPELTNASNRKPKE